MYQDDGGVDVKERGFGVGGERRSVLKTKLSLVL